MKSDVCDCIFPKWYFKNLKNGISKILLTKSSLLMFLFLPSSNVQAMRPNKEV